MYRTHNCGELSLNQKGEKITLTCIDKTTGYPITGLTKLKDVNL